MTVATIWEVFKRTKWHLLLSPLDILLTSLTVLCHHATSCFLSCCGHGLHRILVFLAGQTACCVWHSSFIDGLFISWGVASLSSLLSHWLIQGGVPPTEGPRTLCLLGAPLLTLNGCDTQKNNLQWFSSVLCFLFYCHFTLTPSHKTKDVFIYLII